MKKIDPISQIHDQHPRNSGIWPQYFGLNTRLRGKHYLSDIILPKDDWETFEGSKAAVVDLMEQMPQNYHDTHNHYQLLMSEVWNFVPHSNAIPIWGDGCALAHGSAAWGAFASARSAYIDSNTGENAHFSNAIPEGFALPPRDEFDAQLCGLEVDVLNGGKPGIFPNKAKHGIQVVGFGNPNSHALSVICENFDCPPDERKGQFEAGIYFENSVRPDIGRLLVADFAEAHIGLDFRKPVFDWGAIQLNAPKQGSGIVFGEGRDGEIYSGPRNQQAPQDKTWMTMRMGSEGFRILSADGMRELLVIDTYGGIYVNGELFVNGRRRSIFNRIAMWLDRIFFQG